MGNKLYHSQLVLAMSPDFRGVTQLQLIPNGTGGGGIGETDDCKIADIYNVN